MQRFRGIVFDKDGTLFDFQTTWAAVTARLLSDLSGGDPRLEGALAEAAGFDQKAGRLLPESVIIASTLPETAAALLTAMPRGTEFGWVLERIARSGEGVPQVEAVPLVPYFDLLIARGLRLGLATNDSEAGAQRHLEEAGIDRHFHFVAGYDSGHGAKPAPGQLVAFCAVTGLAPGEVVMVGDSRHDLAAGRAAGMATVAVLTGVANTDELAAEADAVLPDIGHLPGWLELL